MNATRSATAVLRVFALLFSPRWIQRWQRDNAESLTTKRKGAKKNADADAMNASSVCASRYGIRFSSGSTTTARSRR